MVSLKALRLYSSCCTLANFSTSVKGFSLLPVFSHSISTRQYGISALVQCVEHSCPSRGCWCKHPVSMERSGFFCSGVIRVCQVVRKNVKLPQTHLARSRLCLLSQKSDGIMFLCYVKRINGENYRQPFLGNQLEYFRGYKEVFCLH